ncbi:MAG: penicillin-binding protein activator [Pseudomonadota bacterium]
MFSGLDSIRRRSLVIAGAISMAALVACDQITAPAAPRVDAGEATTVALLVPSGSGDGGDAVLAQSLENAARLAMADLPPEIVIDLRIYSTAGDPALAQQAALTAVSEGAKIVLGPVFAQSANAAGAAVRDSGVNVLSFSNNTDIAGGNVFVLGATFQNTANRLVGFAQSQGRGNIAMAYAQSTAGQVAARAVESAIQQSGATLTTRTTYALSQEDVIAAAPAVADGANASGATALILTGDPFGELPLLAQLLPENGLDPANVKMIGLTRWDVPASTLSLPGLQGGWFALPDPALQANFTSRYSSAFQSAPHPIAGLAYDGMAAIGALIASGQANALSTSALTQSQGFAGVNGVFRLLSDGTNQRALAVAEIQESQVVVIDPAPRSFSAGF